MSRALAVAAVLATLMLASCSDGATSSRNDASAEAITSTLAERSSPFSGYRSETYANDEFWLCRPGGAATNYCLDADLDATIARADGSTELVEHQPVEGTAPVDCFYVYPTIPGIDFGPEQLNDLEPLTTLPNKVLVLELQAARYTEVCNLYAPVYRAMTQSGWTAPPDQQEAALDFAYQDVHDAFKHYIANFNNGRPFVLVGHSQGSVHLERLTREELDDQNAALRDQFVSGLLIGGMVQVPPDNDVGGSFETIPLCRMDNQTACVIAYNSYAADPPPDPAVHITFGHDGQATVAACTNPAALGGGEGVLDPYVTGGVAGVTATTPYLRTPDAMRAECASANGITYLALSSATGPGDVRSVEEALTNVGFWGLHLTESNLTQGNLIEIVRTQTDAQL